MEYAETCLSVATYLRIDLAFGEEYIMIPPIVEKFNYVVSSYAKLNGYGPIERNCKLWFSNWGSTMKIS
jgi:hypothetical protein